ncbi:F-box protein CPR1-like isoform X2 [Silene latifolia]
MILMFDLHTEELRKISYPTSLQRHAGCPLELMVSRGRLCTLAAHYSFRSHHSTASMWVMKDYGVVESWTILYEVVGKKISSPQYFEIITHLSRNDSEEVLLLRLFNNEEPELVWYNLENKSITGKADDPATQEYGGDKWVCIPSLAPIPGNDPNKRHTDLAIIDDIKKEVKLAFLAFDGEYHTE